jgi:hypothetical protein
MTVNFHCTMVCSRQARQDTEAKLDPRSVWFVSKTQKQGIIATGTEYIQSFPPGSSRKGIERF